MLRQRTEVSTYASAAPHARSRVHAGRSRIARRWALAPAVGFTAALLAACSQGGGNATPVEIVDPAGTIYTNGTVSVTVRVSDPTVDEVELLLDGEVVGTRVGPLAWELDTTPFAEAEYSLVARASFGGRIHSSEPRTLVVDRTAPTLLQVHSLPANGSSTVWLRDPVVAVLSEPLDPDSVADGRFTVSDPSGPLDLRLELSHDGRSLLAYHQEVPSLPTKVVADFSPELTDLAGNGFVYPEGEWRWGLSDWLLPGGEEEILGPESTYGGNVTIGAGEDGHLYVARREHVYKEGTGDDYDVLVSVWDGSSWTQLGGPVEGDDPLLFGDEPDLTVLPDGTPVVAQYTWLNDGSDPPAELEVSHWDGSAWSPLGEIELLDDSSPDAPAIAAGPAGLPVIAYSQFRLPGKISVQQWSGTEWEALGEPLGSGAFRQADVAVDDRNRPLVLWSEDGQLQLARWQSGVWTILGGADSLNPGSYATGARVEALADGSPIVAWRDAADSTGDANRILIARWDDEQGWQAVGELQLAAGIPGSPAIAPAAGNGAYFGWSQSGEIHVAHWDGSRMSLLPGPINARAGNPGYDPDIVLSYGSPVVAWNGGDGTWVRSYNGLP